MGVRSVNELRGNMPLVSHARPARAFALRGTQLAAFLALPGGDQRVPERDRAAASPAAADRLPAGLEGVKAILGMIRQAFPDHDAAVVQMVAEGDLVATHKTFTGTHLGDFLGVPPTGRRATIRVMDFVRYEDGTITEHWNVVDVAGLLAQLGAA